MNTEEIILMAREAWGRDEDLWLTHEQHFLERFATLVAAAEREACAKVCEDKGMVKGGEVFAARIRARGEVNHAVPISQEQACSHCSHPLYAGIRCSQCGRWTGDDK